MGNFNRNDRSGGRGRFGGGRGSNFNRRNSGPREMHKAVCDKCGNNCRVPFRPSGDKPIYCSSCFEEKERGGGDGSNRRNSRRSNFSERDNLSKELLQEVSSINSKLDRILKVIEARFDEGITTKENKVKPKVKKTISKAKKVVTKKKTRKSTSKTN